MKLERKHLNVNLNNNGNVSKTFFNIPSVFLHIFFFFFFFFRVCILNLEYRADKTRTIKVANERKLSSSGLSPPSGGNRFTIVLNFEAQPTIKSFILAFKNSICYPWSGTSVSDSGHKIKFSQNMLALSYTRHM